MENITEKQLSCIHKLPYKKVFDLLDSTTTGLKEDEVKSRLNTVGLNKLTEKKDKPIIIRFLLQFNNFFSYLLLLGAGLSFFSEWIHPGEGSIYIAWALFGVTILNAGFTFIQEYKAEQAMKSFKKLMTSNVIVLRDGKKVQIDSTGLVPGDIMFLSEGDKITADARIIEEFELKVDHSALTGESEPQLRSIKPTSEKVLLSRNMVLSGTLVQTGLGKAIVVATGDNTQIGKIARATNEVSVETSHLQKQIAYFIKIISYIAIFLGITFLFLGLFVTKSPFFITLVFAIGIIVANVPEGLLPTVTLTLSIAARRMAKKNVLIKNMDAIETFGSITVIATDKTGTLTENNLYVHGFYLNKKFYKFNHNEKQIILGKNVIGERHIKGSAEFSDIMLLCNNSIVDTKTGKKLGDSMDICLKEYASTFHNNEYIEKSHPRKTEIPFSSETKYMITSNRFRNQERAHIKGAPEVILKKCSHLFYEGKTIKLTKKERDDILNRNKEYSKKGFRVLGCALKDISSSKQKKILEKEDYVFYGLIIMQDPPRPEVADAVKLCHQAGMKIIITSGDQGTTVESIGKQVGIISSSNPIVINGDELINYDDDKLKEILQKKEVIFARTLPKDKLRIVSLLQELGEIVAVTGDGVNDAPALRKADVGIAMGKTGTEVAKEASDVVLLDDNFASIIEGIKSGRTIYDNIKSFITYILTSNTPEIVPFLLFISLGWPLALPVLLILVIDLGTDMLPAIGLGMEPSPKDIMERKPRDPKSRLVNWKMVARSYGFVGPLQTFFSYVVFFSILFANGWTWGKDLTVIDPAYMSAITGFLATIIITQVFNLFACRKLRSSIFSGGFFTNKFIFIGIASEIILLALITLLPFFNKLCGTSLFPFKYVPLMILFGFIILFGEEMRKYIFRHYGILGVD